MMQIRDPAVFRKRQELGRRIAAARKAMGLSQDALSRRLGMNQNRISRLELGTTDISRQKVLLYLGLEAGHGE